MTDPKDKVAGTRRKNSEELNKAKDKYEEERDKYAEAVKGNDTERAMLDGIKDVYESVSKKIGDEK